MGDQNSNRCNVEKNDKYSLRHKVILKLIRLVFILMILYILSLVIISIAMKYGLTNSKSIIDANLNIKNNLNQNAFPWKYNREWQTIKNAIIKDKDYINKVANLTKTDPRLIASLLVPEQLRLMHDNRELFKKIFFPLQILVNQNQFSWGIMGIKQKTAIKIEQNLKDKNSDYYPGIEFEHILDFDTSENASVGSQRFERLTNDKNHYYSYLYAALYIKQIMEQWKRHNFDISSKTEILATLYNIGFDHSRPNPYPHSGGAIILIDNMQFSFGSLAKDFYDSDELTQIFEKRH